MNVSWHEYRMTKQEMEHQIAVANENNTRKLEDHQHAQANQNHTYSMLREEHEHKQAMAVSLVHFTLYRNRY